MRIVSEIDLRNARCRAVWIERFYSGVACADPCRPHERAWYDHVIRIGHSNAMAWIAAGKKFKRAQAIALANNITPLPSRRVIDG